MLPHMLFHNLLHVSKVKISIFIPNVAFLSKFQLTTDLPMLVIASHKADCLGKTNFDYVYV